MDFDELLDNVAARTPAPGGGSVAAWAGALAAALLEMVAAYAEDAEAVARGGVLRASLLEDAERELDSYAPVLAAGEDRERRARALVAASEVPLSIARAGAEVAELAAAAIDRLRPAVVGDAAAAALLADASVQAAVRLVRTNLAGSDQGSALLEEAAALASAAAAVRDRLSRA